MFSWFQKLLPRRGDFFGMFEGHAATLVGAAHELQKLGTDGVSTAEVLRVIRDREHDADALIREVLIEVRKTFLTPFDRSAIKSLIVAMDDTIDDMLAAARAINLYDLHDLRPEMKEIIALIVESASLTAEAVPLMRKIVDNGGRLNELTARIVHLEGQADEIEAAGLKRAFDDAKGNALQFAAARDVFRNLEHVMDSFEDIANEIDGIVIDHS